MCKYHITDILFAYCSQVEALGKAHSHVYFLSEAFLAFMLCLMITFTISGSARVEMSPRSSVSLEATFRRILLIIFPDLVLGRLGVY